MSQRTSTKTIIRVEHDRENPYMMLSRELPNDKSISYEALGLLTYLLSKPDDWQVVPSDLERKGCGRDKVYRLLGELKEAGHIITNEVREKGKFVRVEYTVIERRWLKAEPYTEKPDTAEPDTEKPYREKPTQLNSKETKEKDSHAPPKPARPRDPIYDAISTTWQTTASGLIVRLKSLMLGTCKIRGVKDSNFDAPVTDAQEIIDFGAWWKKTHAGLTIPTSPPALQGFFYEFRASRRRSEPSAEAQAKQAAYEEWLHSLPVHDPKWMGGWDVVGLPS